MAFWTSVKSSGRKGRAYIDALVTWHTFTGVLALLQVALVAFIGFFFYSTGKRAVIFKTRFEVCIIRILEAVVTDALTVFGSAKSKGPLDKAWK